MEGRVLITIKLRTYTNVLYIFHFKTYRNSFIALQNTLAKHEIGSYRTFPPLAQHVYNIYFCKYDLNV